MESGVFCALAGAADRMVKVTKHPVARDREKTYLPPLDR